MADSATQFYLQRIETRVGPLALVTMDNGEDWQKPNVFGRAALESLHDLLPRLREDEWKASSSRASRSSSPSAPT